MDLVFRRRELWLGRVVLRQDIIRGVCRPGVRRGRIWLGGIVLLLREVVVMLAVGRRELGMRRISVVLCENDIIAV